MLENKIATWSAPRDFITRIEGGEITRYGQSRLTL